MRLGAAMLFVIDLDRMIAFYRDTLGISLIEDSRLPDWAEFDTGPTRFALHAIPNPTGPASAAPREQAPTKLTFAVDDTESEIARLEALGVPILDRPWGGRELVDPEGNIFALSGPRP